MKTVIRKEGKEWQFKIAGTKQKNIWHDYPQFPSDIRNHIMREHELEFEQASKILMEVEEKIQATIKFEKESAARRKTEGKGG